MRTNAPASKAETSPDAGAVTPEPVLGADLLVAFLNTLDIDEGTDVLDDPAGFDAWCSERAVSVGDRAEARSVRDALRSFLDGATPSLPSLELETTCGERGVALRARTAAEAAVASSVVLSIQGSMARVKLCAADDYRRSCGSARLTRSTAVAGGASLYLFASSCPVRAWMAAMTSSVAWRRARPESALP